MDALTGRATITATEAAELAGLSPSAMSYHLRALAKWGIVREADPAGDGDGRERRWERVGAGLSVDPPDHGADAATAFIATHYLDNTAPNSRAGSIRWATRPSSGARTPSSPSARRGSPRSRSVEVRRIADRLLEYTGAAKDNPPPDARRMRLAFMLFPVDRGTRR